MSPVPTGDTGGEYLDAKTAVMQWQNFIAEDRRSLSPLENRLFRWDFVPLGPGDDDAADYWVQIGIFNGNRKAAADELLRALKKHIPISKIEDRGHDAGRYAVRIGPFKHEWEAWRVARDIMTTR